MRRRGKPWTQHELELLERLYPRHPRKRVAELIGRSSKAVASMAKRLRIRNPRNHDWSREDRKVLRSLFPHKPSAEVAQQLGRSLSSVQGMAAKLGLSKTQEYLDSPAACRLRRGDNIGAASRFPKGHVPANKGMRRPGWSMGRMKETQFKKGERPHTWKPIGATRYSDGYLQRKISDTGYPPRDWKGVHILLWEEAHGPVPANHTVCFKDGNKENIVIENLELVSRTALMARNTIQNLPPELKDTIRAVASLNRVIRRKSDGKK